MFGPWSGSIEGPDRLFKLTQSLEIPSIECFHDMYMTYILITLIFLVNSTNRCFVCTGKDRRDHLVEWVEKSSFACLNKLLEIDQAEQNHGLLLIEKNLRVILAQAMPFVIPFFPRLAPSTLVSGKHFVLNDLPFYEIARLATAKTRQANLDVRERKCQEGTLQQAPCSTSSIISSLVPWPTKKKTVIRPQAQ